MSICSTEHTRGPRRRLPGKYFNIFNIQLLTFKIFPQIFVTPPDTGFDCDAQIEGYYSDQDADCQAFHICGNDGSGSLIKYSFLCPNGESPLSLLLVHMIILFTLQGLCSTSSTSSVIGGLTWTVLRSDRSAQYLIMTDSSLPPRHKTSIP